MERALFILNFISTCFCILAAIASCICLYKPNDLITRIMISSSFAIVALVAIPELIINILICQEYYAYFIFKIILCTTMVILNIIVVCKKTKKGDFQKEN